ncbi:PqqD family peptide modification chaperone [Actinomadura violacea]|nr:PqqD family peptide modification chaperone [Actinomadura violacea]
MIVRLHPEVQHVRTGEQHLLLDQRDGGYYALNPSAATLIDQLTTGATAAHLADTLAGRFQIDSGRARADVLALVVELNNSGLLLEDGR